MFEIMCEKCLYYIHDSPACKLRYRLTVASFHSVGYMKYGTDDRAEPVCEDFADLLSKGGKPYEGQEVVV